MKRRTGSNRGKEEWGGRWCVELGELLSGVWAHRLDGSESKDMVPWADEALAVVERWNVGEEESKRRMEHRLVGVRPTRRCS